MISLKHLPERTSLPPVIEPEVEDAEQKGAYLDKIEWKPDMKDFTRIVNDEMAGVAEMGTVSGTEIKLQDGERTRQVERNRDRGKDESEKVSNPDPFKANAPVSANYQEQCPTGVYKDDCVGQQKIKHTGAPFLGFIFNNNFGRAAYSSVNESQFVALHHAFKAITLLL